MATPGELVKVIAAATGEDEATVAQHDRNLVVAGLRSKGGRGRSAAKVTTRDAACLLTSLLGSHRVKDSAETVRRFLETQESTAWWYQYYPENVQNMGRENVWEDYVIPEMATLPRSHSFIDAIETLITIAAAGKLFGYLGDSPSFDNCSIYASSPMTHGRITMRYRNGKGERRSLKADYQLNTPPADWMKDGRLPVPPEETRPRPRLDRDTKANAMPIIYIGALLAGELHQLPKINPT